MMFSGGKHRVAKEIASVLRGLRPPGSLFVEPFAGSCAVTEQMENPRVAADIDGELIAMWRAAQSGWVPPTVITEDDYRRIKNDNAAPAELRAFVAYPCSYAGKRWGGYARGCLRNYADTSSRSIVKRAANLQGVAFYHADFFDWQTPGNCLVYCDPPYLRTTKPGATRRFAYDAFVERARSWSLSNVVVVSEYQAPAPDFIEVWSRAITKGPWAQGKGGKQLADRRAYERLYVWSGSPWLNQQPANTNA